MNQHHKLGELYRKFRRMATLYNIDILTAGQAHADAAGKKRVKIDHMHNSKTDKPGALDYAIGIGTDDHEQMRRYLNIVKNKIGTTKREINTVRFDIPYQRFKDIV